MTCDQTIKKTLDRLILCFPDSNTHWSRRNLAFCVLCARVNILCKHVQVCVCVCSSIFVDMAMGIDNTRFGVATNHREIEGAIGHLYLLVLLSWLRYAWKLGLEPEMDSGIWLYVGKVLGTSRHPFVDGYLSPCALVCVWSIKWMLDYF